MCSLMSSIGKPISTGIKIDLFLSFVFEVEMSWPKSYSNFI